MSVIKILFTLLLLFFSTALYSQSGFTYPTCSTPLDWAADFTQATLVEDLDEPIKMDFYQNPHGDITIYFVERGGSIRAFDISTGQLTEVGRPPDAMVEPGKEDGLTGIALDPDFENNRQMFLMYSIRNDNLNKDNIENTKVNCDVKEINERQLARFTLDAQNKLIDSSKIVLLSYSTRMTEWHTGGAMMFDGYGDLWIGTGDNESTESGPQNTHNLRGKILRIHPEPDGSYTIPKDNLGEYWSGIFAGEGRTELAADYLNPEIVHPEIYVMGARNPYSLYVEPVTRWMAFGDVGPDHWKEDGDDTEEYNLVQNPSNQGWGYFAGNASITGELVPYDNWTTANPSLNDKLFPENTLAGITGARELPPIEDPVYSIRKSSAITGPIVRYDGRNADLGALPPQLNGAWLIGNYGQGWIRALKLNDEGTSVLFEEEAFPAVGKPLDIKHGPDGALYIIDYQGNNIQRISYNGDCKDENLIPVQIATGRYMWPGLLEGIEFRGGKLMINSLEKVSVTIHNVRGEIVYRQNDITNKDIQLNKFPWAGILIATVSNGRDVWSGKLPAF